MLHKKLFLMRHAEALSHDADAKRPLSPLGEVHAKKMALWLHSMQIEIDTIIHSGVLRAEQTASIVAEQYKITPIQSDALAPDASIVSLAEIIGDLQNNTLLVGHLPNLDLLSNLLITYDEQCTTLSFQPAAMAAFNLSENQCLVEWFVQPGIISEEAILL